MGDKSLSIFLMVLFGMSGIAILMLAWLWQMPASERILTTLIGSTGLFIAVSRGLLLRSSKARIEATQVTVKIER